MFKKIALALGLLVILAVIGFGFLWSSLDGIIRTAIEKYGTAATQTTVSLDSVKLSVTSGEGSLGGLSVDNPKDFNHGVKAFYLGLITVKVDTSSIKGNGPILIKEVDIEKPQVNYEIATNGGSNLAVIQNNAVSYANSMSGSSGGNGAGGNASPPSAGSNGSKSGGRKIIISDLFVRSGQIGISTAMIKDKNFTAPLPEIHLTNIGKASGGATAAEVAQQILSSITASAGKVAMSTISRNLGGLVDPNAVNTLKGAANDSSSNVKNQLKGMFGQ